MRMHVQAGMAAVGVTLALVSVTLATARASDPVGSSVAIPGAPAVGDVVDHKFGTPPMNSGGLTNLADLRGKPLLIEFWGTR